MKGGSRQLFANFLPQMYVPAIIFLLTYREMNKQLNEANNDLNGELASMKSTLATHELTKFTVSSWRNELHCHSDPGSERYR